LPVRDQDTGLSYDYYCQQKKLFIKVFSTFENENIMKYVSGKPACNALYIVNTFAFDKNTSAHGLGIVITELEALLFDEGGLWAHRPTKDGFTLTFVGPDTH
jgi:hypothetical protein